MTHSITVLLLEDNPADVELTREAFGEEKLVVNLEVVTDGAAASDYLHQRGRYADAKVPDLIVLDLNVPRVSGMDILAEIKSNDALRAIPVVILTSSQSETDIVSSYKLGANCYVSKPLDFSAFLNIVKTIENFWFTVVKLPPRASG